MQIFCSCVDWGNTNTSKFNNNNANQKQIEAKMLSRRNWSRRNRSIDELECYQASYMRALIAYWNPPFQNSRPPLPNPTNTQCQYHSLNSYRSAISSVHEIQTIPPRRCIVCTYTKMPVAKQTKTR